jgi:hypothetical protein
MRNLFVVLLAAFTVISCNQKSKEQTGNQSDKKNENSKYLITKEGIGEILVGMKHQEVEKILNQKLTFKHPKDSTDSWRDTVMTKYKDLDITLYFEKEYTGDNTTQMQLISIETSSSLCKTASGVGIGDEKAAVIAAYNNNPIDMGPVSENINDSTIVFSKTKYYINIKDDKWDKELIFNLVNNKVASVGATIILGE